MEITLIAIKAKFTILVNLGTFDLFSIGVQFTLNAKSTHVD